MQPFKIEQGIGILQGLHTSFNGFKEDKRLFFHKMCRVLRQVAINGHYMSSRERYHDSISINCNFQFQILGETWRLFLKKIR